MIIRICSKHIIAKDFPGDMVIDLNSQWGESIFDQPMRWEYFEQPCGWGDGRGGGDGWGVYMNRALNTEDELSIASDSI